MADKVKIEFINTWPSCNQYSEFVKEICSRYEGKIDLKLYYAGKDMSYVRKYGMVMKGTLIINERKKVDRLSKAVIQKEIEEAMG